MHVASTELVDALGSGVNALLRYKLRTALSVLGIVLGVAGVVAMVSVGEGARRQTLAQVERLGLDNIVARSRMPSLAGMERPGLRLADAARIRDLVPAVAFASPLTERHVRLHGDTGPHSTPVLGVGPEFDTVLRLQLASGRFLSAVDEREGAAVCVVGAALASRLGDGRGPVVGTHVRLGLEHCQVIGVLRGSARETTTANDPAWRQLDDAALMPVSRVSGRPVDAAPAQRVDEIWLQIDGADHVAPAAAILARALDTARVGQFDIIVPRQLLEQRQRTYRTFNVVTGSIAALALLVGGIGVMNVMLMSVSERAYEIGVRRAVGATRRAIRTQFLVEALLVTVSGGIAGIVAGVLLSRLITWYASWPTSLSAGSVVAAVGISAAVGIAFGLYPAIRAARLAPMEAVRRE